MNHPTTAPGAASEAHGVLAPAMSPEAMIRAAAEVVGARAAGLFTLSFTRPTPQAPVSLTLTADERRASIAVKDLRRRLAMAAAPAELGAVVDLIEKWADQRPVSDAEASEVGVATLMWAAAAGREPGRDPGTDLRWQIVSSGRLHAQPMPWLPASSTARGATAKIRAATLANAIALPVTPIAAGDVVVWTYAPHPALSSAVLVDISRAQAFSAAHLGLAPTDLWMVAAPGRPVAIADKAAAQRLSEETTAAHVCCPLALAARIGW